MKKIRMTACVLILALVVCALAGCSNKNNTGMADEATTASQSASDGANGSMGESGTAANGMESNGSMENGGAGNGTEGTGGTTGNGMTGTGDMTGNDNIGNPGNTAGTGETANPAGGNRSNVRESTGVVDGLVNDVERAVDR